MKESSSQPVQQPTQTLGAKALQALISLLAGLLVGIVSGVLVCLAGGIMLYAFAMLMGGGKSAFNMVRGLVILLVPVALIVALIVGLIASVVIHIVRSRQGAQANRAFTNSI